MTEFGAQWRLRRNLKRRIYKGESGTRPHEYRSLGMVRPYTEPKPDAYLAYASADVNPSVARRGKISDSGAFCPADLA